MDIPQLRTLIQVAELGSLSKAAGRLHIAQPALSRQVRMLEEELGVRLFDRHGRGMVLTEPGQAVVQHARRVLADLDELRTIASGTGGAELRGTVAIGLPPTVGDVIGVPLVAAFREQHPGVMVRLVTAFTGDILDLLLRGELDVAVLYDPSATRLLRATWLMQEGLYLIGPPTSDLSIERPVPFAVAAREKLLLPSTRQGLRHILENIAHDAGCVFNLIAEIDSYATLKDLIRQGYGYTILSLAPFQQEVATGTLKAAPMIDPAPIRNLALSFPSDRPISRAAEFAGELLKEIVTSHLQGVAGPMKPDAAEPDVSG